MKTMAISKFKAHALKVLNEVAKSQETIVITKRGKPLAQVVPYHKSAMKPTPGKLSNAFVFETDIVTPQGEGLWEAYQKLTGHPKNISFYFNGYSLMDEKNLIILGVP